MRRDSFLRSLLAIPPAVVTVPSLSSPAETSESQDTTAKFTPLNTYYDGAGNYWLDIEYRDGTFVVANEYLHK